MLQLRFDVESKITFKSHLKAIVFAGFWHGHWVPSSPTQNFFWIMHWWFLAPSKEGECKFTTLYFCLFGKHGNWSDPQIKYSLSVWICASWSYTAVMTKYLKDSLHLICLTQITPPNYQLCLNWGEPSHHTICDGLAIHIVYWSGSPLRSIFLMTGGKQCTLA